METIWYILCTKADEVQEHGSITTVSPKTALAYNRDTYKDPIWFETEEEYLLKCAELGIELDEHTSQPE